MSVYANNERSLEPNLGIYIWYYILLHLPAACFRTDVLQFCRIVGKRWTAFSHSLFNVFHVGTRGSRPEDYKKEIEKCL